MKMILEKNWELNDKTYLAFLELDKGIQQGTEKEILASNAAGRMWSPSNADDSCVKYVPGVQE